jgi:glyoxylase-like metal-dependent hydrolase (beta-lactamase superfamily II)
MKLYTFTAGYSLVIGRLMRKDQPLKFIRMPMVCFLLERSDGLILVDTGLGTVTVRNPAEFPGIFYTMALSFRIREGEEAISRVKSLGYHATDVKHIILTHLHMDHVGGLGDFPDAEVHVTRQGYNTMNEQAGKFMSFFHSGAFKHSPKWQFNELDEKPFLGFPQSLDLFGDGNVVMVGTPGHTAGHIGVAITLKNEIFLHLGDAALFEDQFRNPSVVAIGAKIFRWKANSTPIKEMTSQKQIAAACGNIMGLHTICSHDAWTFERWPRFPEPLATG